MKGLIVSQDFLQVYLINGEDELKRKYVLKRLVGRIAKLGDLDFNQDIFQGDSSSAEELIAACNTMPFMCEYRLVICHNVDKASKAFQDALVTYLEHPASFCILALEAAKLAKNSRLYKAILRFNKKSLIDCSPKNARDLPAQIRSLATSNRVSMSEAAARELLDRVGDSTLRLDTEIKKMAIALGINSSIGVEEVKSLVERTAETKPWLLADALCDRDSKRVLLLLNRLESQSVFALLTICINRIRELLVAKDQGNHINLQLLAQDLGVPQWRIKNHARWANNFSHKQLEKALITAAQLEQNLKTGGQRTILFENWLLSICH